jgi:hypothetical protein
MMYIEALVPSFHKPLKTSSIKFFGLLSEPGGDFPFRCYHNEGHDMLARMSQVMSLGFTITSPRPSVRQCSGNILRCLPKKFKVTPSSRKVKPQRQTVNADSYCNILRKLCKAIQRKWPGHRTREATAWFRQQPKELYAAGFQGLVKWWDKCLNVQGDYVDKSIFQISTLVRLSSISICNLLTYLRSLL